MPSNGFRSAYGDKGDRQLHADRVHVAVNMNSSVAEITMRDEDAPRERRWTSILRDHGTGEIVGVGVGHDNASAYRSATSAAMEV